MFDSSFLDLNNRIRQACHQATKIPPAGRRGYHSSTCYQGTQSHSTLAEGYEPFLWSTNNITTPGAGDIWHGWWDCGWGRRRCTWCWDLLISVNFSHRLSFMQRDMRQILLADRTFSNQEEARILAASSRAMGSFPTLKVVFGRIVSAGSKSGQETWTTPPAANRPRMLYAQHSKGLTVLAPLRGRLIQALSIEGISKWPVGDEISREGVV